MALYLHMGLILILMISVGLSLGLDQWRFRISVLRFLDSLVKYTRGARLELNHALSAHWHIGELSRSESSSTSVITASLRALEARLLN